MLCDLVEKGYLARTKRGIYMIPEEKRVSMAAEESLPFYATAAYARACGLYSFPLLE